MEAVAEHIKVPELRFPEFSGEWNGQRLGEFIKVNPPDMPLPNSFYYIDLDAVDKGILKDAEKTSLESAPSRAQRFLEVGDVLFQMVRPYQKNNLWFREKTGEYVASTGYAVLRSKCQSFTYQLLHTPQFNNHVRVRCTGSSYPAINTSELRLIPVQFPSLPEQQKIAEFLTTVDEKIGKLKRKKELLEAYKKGAMQKLFSQEIRFKDDQGNPYPDWEEKRLGDCLFERSEKTSVNNQFEVLSSTAKGLFRQEEYFNRQIASKENIGYKILRKNQVVLSPQNLWLGNINLNQNFEIGIVSPSYKIFEISSEVHQGYLGPYLRIPRMFYEYAQASEQGASVVRRNLDSDLFSQIAINIPSLPEQQKIAEFLTGIDDKIKAVANQIDQAAEFKKGLLQKMFV